MLYDHQKKIIQDNPFWKGIGLGTGGGKTRVCLELAESPVLVVAPKQQREDKTWQINAKKFGIELDITVISKEDFRRDWKKLGAFKTVIFDECHTIFGASPATYQQNYVKYPKFSQTFEAARDYLKRHRPARLYLASATPVTKPMHMWAAATILGEKWDWFKFRDKYYFEKRPNVWLPRKSVELQIRLAELVKKFFYTGQLSDWFDVPEQVHKEVFFHLSPEQRKAIDALCKAEADPMIRRTKIRAIENGVLYKKIPVMRENGEEDMIDAVETFETKKIEYLAERATEFPKVLIFATYTAQIASIASKLREEGHKVLTLTGATKKRGELLIEAETSARCVVIAQSSISSGYELPSFPCVIYASKSYKYVDYEQSLGRVLRANALKKNLYIHLIVDGGVDNMCHEAIMEGRDFQQMVMEDLSPEE